MKNKMGKGALMMNQNSERILSAGAKPHWLESTFGQALKAIGEAIAAGLGEGA